MKIRARAVTVAVSVALIISSASAPAFAATVDSTGPLTRIEISQDLGCSAQHASDSHGEWYGGTACGTFAAVDGELYGPGVIPAGSSVTNDPRYHRWTNISQSQAGSGTASDPFIITTVVDAGDTGLRLTEIDQYMTGRETYETSIRVTNTTNTAIAYRIYHGADCYLQDNDFGGGTVSSSLETLSDDAPVCTTSSDSSHPDRILGFFPETVGNTYFEGYYNDMWSLIADQGPLPNTYVADNIDNSVAISWNGSVEVNNSKVYFLQTKLSPTDPSAPPLPNRHVASVDNNAALGQECAQVMFVGVRGSGQTNDDGEGYGDEVDMVREAMDDTLAGSVNLRQVYVDYPADAVSVLLDPNDGIERYLASIESGVADLSAVLSDSATRCPSEKWVVAGYSQGALVVNEAV